MGGLCAYKTDPSNEEETNMFSEEGRILVKKHKTSEYENKDLIFYSESPSHKEIQNHIYRKKNSTRYTTKEYPNGSTKVILF